MTDISPELRAILDRDGRTIGAGYLRVDPFAHCKRDSFSIHRFPVMFFRISNYGMCAVASAACESRRPPRNSRINLDHLIKRLVRVFVFGVCFLTVVRAPTAMSAPTSFRERDGPEESIPKWTVPCGQMLQNSSGSDRSSSDRDIAVPIATQAKIALNHMYSFRENYTEETFHVRYSEHFINTKHNMYEWLPKDVARSPEPHVKPKELEHYLKLYYVAMQKYAVGIEQVVKDQMQMNGPFQAQLNDTEDYLRSVLCELSSGLFSRGIIPPNVVDRSIMDDKTRNLVDTAHRNLRDWIIIREYIKGLESLLQSLEPFEGNQPS